MPNTLVQDTCVSRYGKSALIVLVGAFVFGCGGEPKAGDGSIGAVGLAAQASSPAASAQGKPDTPASPETLTSAGAPIIEIDIRRSLVVTEVPILARFTFQRVMEQLAAQSGVPGVTALSLFQQWWDTQNPKADPHDTRPHCDDFVDEQGGTTLNTYPYLCRPAPSEGGQSTCNPFTPDSPCAYVPIGLFNRFDQAPADGSHCGEHRLVFAKQGGMTNTRDRNLVIFEAALMNPLPHQGLRGCRKIVDVWAALTREDDLEKRADALERFYFQGLGNVPPVISIAHLGVNPLGLGQVRTNQFIETNTGWSLREFKLRKRCAGASCELVFVPESAKTNAYGVLFEPDSDHQNAASFRAFFPSQVASLAVNELTTIGMTVPDIYNSGQSQTSSSTADEMRYLERLGSDPSALRSAVDNELADLGSSLTVDDVVLRAQAMSCAGCHRLNNGADIGGGLTWPSAIGFVHVSERDPEIVNGVTRYRTSDALNNAFLPLRKSIIEDYLNNKPLPSRGPKEPIGGNRSHG